MCTNPSNIGVKANVIIRENCVFGDVEKKKPKQNEQLCCHLVSLVYMTQSQESPDAPGSFHP